MSVVIWELLYHRSLLAVVLSGFQPLGISYREDAQVRVVIRDSSGMPNESPLSHHVGAKFTMQNLFDSKSEIRFIANVGITVGSSFDRSLL